MSKKALLRELAGDSKKSARELVQDSTPASTAPISAHFRRGAFERVFPDLSRLGIVPRGRKTSSKGETISNRHLALLLLAASEDFDELSSSTNLAELEERLRPRLAALDPTAVEIALQILSIGVTILYAPTPGRTQPQTPSSPPRCGVCGASFEPQIKKGALECANGHRWQLPTSSK